MPSILDIARRVSTGIKGAFATMANTNITLPEELKPIIAIDPEERRRQREVLRARAFHDGVHGSKLTDRIREHLGLEVYEDCEFALNFCAGVVMAVAERLKVQRIKCSEDNPDLTEAERKRQEAWANRLWKLLGLKAKQADLAEACVRDGEYYIVYEWDNVAAQPAVYLYQRYTDPEVHAPGRRGYGNAEGLRGFYWSGDGEGVRMFYRNNDPNQGAEYAVKRWCERLPGGKREKRITIYYPDHVVTYHLSGLGWVLTEEIPWVNPRTNEPLGIPVVEFFMPGRQPEARRAWIPQRILNKLALDVLQIVDVSAFRIWLYFGWSPKDKDGKPITIAPNRWIGVENKTKEQASAQPVDGVDPAPVGEILDSFIVKLASLTDTPTSRLLTTRQIAAEGTLKQQEAPLVAKCSRRQENLESSWEKLFGKLRLLQNAFGSDQYDPNVLFELEWAPIDTRSADDDLKEARVRQAEIQNQVLLQQLGVSELQSQRDLGYSDAQISQMGKEKGAERETAATNATKMFNNGFGMAG